MTWNVVVTPDAAFDGVAIQIGRRLADGTLQGLTFAQDVTTREPGTSWPAPSMQFTDDLARALLDALADHFGNTSGGRQQRADFEHERGRVDRLIGVMEGVVIASCAPPAHLYAESRDGR